MANLFQADPTQSGLYRGLSSLFGYVNQDGKLSKTNCGLAACATLLTFSGAMPRLENTAEHENPNMLNLESHFPPNILCGMAGTSRGRVERILDAHGYEAVEIKGEQQLRDSLELQQPVAVMLQVPGSAVMGMSMPAGHWMVAYGYNDEAVYLTNWWQHAMSWQEFRDGWNGAIPWCINMDRKGLIIRPWVR